MWGLFFACAWNCLVDLADRYWVREREKYIRSAEWCECFVHVAETIYAEETITKKINNACGMWGWRAVCWCGGCCDFGQKWMTFELLKGKGRGGRVDNEMNGKCDEQWSKTIGLAICLLFLVVFRKFLNGNCLKFCYG